ncbi:aminoglycoside N(3)-acetyltransferase [Paenibacillus sp. CF384]|uniref:aminoglycoside N(3)-acetyltransferase n=1 Tax=Paenibacillus sp. CF384 TaxID=1884382 RepID=UPI00089C4EC2|nr:AAC(3) family N-acetyltransferase [Paenibacillus sp. CF384]SDW20164.1 aminoglycoside 3-N-acetyltransferase [Paenibacillus sp. CF384]
MVINESELPLTRKSIAAALSQIGVEPGMTLLVHSSLKSFNRWIVGGAEAVVLGLEDAIGEDGTLVMPTHSSDLSDPALWANPPVPQDWWPIIRNEMPAFSPDLTVTSGMGRLVECFRKQNGTLRSGHPQVSFAARGPKAAFITEGHSLEFGLGEHSPLGKLYACGAFVLLLGVGHGNNTSFHLAEYRTSYPGKSEMTQGAPIAVDGVREWVTFPDININSDDFAELGTAFDAHAGGSMKSGFLGDAEIKLMSQRELVDFGIDWLASFRKQ